MDRVPYSVNEQICISENYMNRRIYESPSIEEIAKIVGVSQAGLKRIFKKIFGAGRS